MWKKIILYSGLLLALSCNLQEKGSSASNTSRKTSFGGTFDGQSQPVIASKKKEIATEHIQYPQPKETPVFTVNSQPVRGPIPLTYTPTENIQSFSTAQKMEQKPVHVSAKTIGNRAQIESVAAESRANGTEKNKSTFLYLAGIIGIAVYSLFRIFRNTSLKITRWANAHKWTTRGLILGGQITLGALGVQLGKALHDAGYNFTDKTEYLFGGIMLLGLFQLTLQKKEVVTSLRSFYQQRLGFLAVSVSMFMLLTGIGNQIGTGKNQDRYFPKAVEQLDSYFTENSSIASEVAHPDPEPKEEAKPKNNDGKALLILAYVFLAILLVLLLFIACCALWCTFDSVVGLPATLLSVVLLYFVIRAMAKHVKSKYP